MAVGHSVQYRRSPLKLKPLNMPALRWLAAIVPAGLLIGVDYARHFIFPFAMMHDILGFTLLWLGSVVGTIVFSSIVFGTIERTQRAIVQQNRELSNLYKAANRQAEQLGALREAGMALTAELGIDVVLQKGADLSRDLVGARFGSLAVLDEEKRSEKLITSGLSPEARARITEFPKGLCIMAVGPHDVKPVRIADISKHPLSVGFAPHHPKMTSMLGLPIVSKAASTAGSTADLPLP